MSAATFGIRPELALDRESLSAAGPVEASYWSVAGVALLVGLAFFVSEHSPEISLADAYTQTADEMEVSATGGNGLRRIAFFALAGMGCWLLLRSRCEPLRINPLLAFTMLGYLLLAAVSCLWAIDPGMCLRRLIVLACCTLATCGIGRRFTMRQLCELALCIVGPLVLFGLACELRLGTFRPWSADYRFSGTVHPNTQGMYLTVLCLSALGLARSDVRGRWKYWTIFGSCLVLLLLTKSRTGNASTLAAIASVFLLQTPLRFKLTAGFMMAWTGLAMLWLLMMAGIEPLVDFREALLLGRAEQTESLSGRAFIWPIVTHHIGQRPWIGHGYEAFWNPGNIDVISDELQWGLREAHNGYLEVLLSTGVVGLSLVLVIVLAGLAAAARGSIKVGDPAYALPLGMLVFGILSSTMESGMVNVMFPPFLTACCLMRLALCEENAGKESF